MEIIRHRTGRAGTSKTVGPILGLLLAAPLFWVGCQAEEVVEITPDAVERAQARLEPFRQRLVGALMEALGEGGPETAIEVCKERAPEIAAELSSIT